MTNKISDDTKCDMNLGEQFKAFLAQLSMQCEIEIDKLEDKYCAVMTGSDAHTIQFFSQNFRWEIESSNEKLDPPKISINTEDQNNLMNSFTEKMLTNEQIRLFKFYLAKGLISKIDSTNENELMASAIGFNLGLEFSKLSSDLNRNDVEPKKIFEILVRNHLNREPEISTKELTLSLMDVKTFEKLQMNYFHELFFKGCEELTDSENIFYFLKNGTKTSTSYGTIENLIGIVKSSIKRK